ncbi:protein of unknown function [Ectopseudomonas oleovorans]|nr:protein of unknown function [Pseudomonas oleovorans]
MSPFGDKGRPVRYLALMGRSLESAAGTSGCWAFRSAPFGGMGEAASGCSSSRGRAGRMRRRLSCLVAVAAPLCGARPPICREPEQ